MQPSVPEAKVRCCFLQLYSDLQPRNAEPLSIEVLASAISQALPGVSIRLSLLGSFQSQVEREDIMTALLAEHYDMIGLSCPQGTYELAVELLSIIAQIDCPPTVMLGHALPTSLPDLFLLHYPRALIVRGWGEPAVIALCQQLTSRQIQLEQIPGITYLDAEGTRHDTPVIWAENVPAPRRINPPRYFARIEASRGCHYNRCTFCSRPPRATRQPPWIRLQNSTVLAQVEQLVQAGITSFTFADEDFIGHDLAGALDLATQLRRFPNLDFALSVRTDNVIATSDSPQEQALRQQLFSTLKEAGLTLVFVGIESFARSQLHRFGKGTSPEHSIEAVRFLESLAIELELGLIVFDPLLSREELALTIATLQKTGLWRYSGQLFSFLRPQIGTPYVKLLKRHGLLGPFRPNTAEYQARYLDSEIEKIMHLCQAWNQKYHPFYLALRNMKRSELGTGDYTYAIRRYRFLQLQFLTSLVKAIEEKRGDIMPDFAYWDEAVMEIMWSVQMELRTRSSRSRGENDLLRVVSSSLARQCCTCSDIEKERVS